MPFSCAVKGGKPTISTAAPTRYEIIGERQQRNYRACKDATGGDCRTMAVHRFDVLCQGISAPWEVIAAQIRTNDVGSSWIENGQLNLLLKKPDQAASGRRMARFVMPKGYAPVTELGAHLVAAVGEVNLAAGERALEGGGQRIIPTIDNAVVVLPGDTAHVVPAVLSGVGEGGAGDGAETGWQAVVYHAEGAVGAGTGGTWLSADLAGGSNVTILMFILAGTSLVAGLGWYGRRFALSVREKETLSAIAGAGTRSLEKATGNLFARVSGAADGVGARLQSRWVSFKWRRHKSGKPWEWSNSSIANGARAAEALYEKADQAVRGLGPASALRDTLSAELKSVRARLDGLRSGSGEQPKTARVAASLRSVVRDLERIGRIAESAAASVKGVREEVVMPKSRAQAFEVLGVNADASEGTLKRIVDALRMGWHPDHAKDEADKRVREERTKQINIAWDLIVGKRVA